MRPPRLDQLDDLDRNLVALLQANARESVADLARQLGVARTTVIARIARLERTNVIAGYSVRLGQDVLDAEARAGRAEAARQDARSAAAMRGERRV
jgi:DNA-binding Lrp family transcriptional regulator